MLLTEPATEPVTAAAFPVPSYVTGEFVTDKVGVVRVSVETFNIPVVAAKNVLFLLVAVEEVEPQVPLILPKPPRLRLLTVRVSPAPMLAVAVPVGAMLKLPAVEVPVIMVFAPLPLKMRLL